jgi:hypothetical protein
VKKNISVLILAGAGLLAGRAFAVLPPDAAMRAPQIRAQYMRSARAYEERQKLRQIEAVEQYRKTEAAIYTPPWNRSAAPSAVAASAVSAPAQKAVAEHRVQKWTFSIIALFLICGAVWWVRITTEPE